MNSQEEAKALEKALDAAKDYADAVFMGSLKEFGGILSDTVGYWRLKNRIRLLLKSKQFLEANGIVPRKLLPDIFVPLIEDGGNVEDVKLSDMFASLLAGHLDPNQHEYIHPSYTKVLSQLSPLDARTMLIFRDLASDRQYRELGFTGAKLTVQDTADKLSCSVSAMNLSCINLDRLGILTHDGFMSPKDHPMPELFENNPKFQFYRISEYGIAFCDACQYKIKREGAA